MTRSRVCVVVALLLVLRAAAPASAQAPNFSGRWVFDAAKSTGEPSVPRIFNPTGAKPSNPTLTIKQTPADLNVTVGDVRLLYKLDGSERNISADGRAGFPTGKATWDAGKLVIALSQEVFDAAKGDYVKVPGKEIYQLDHGTLTIEKSQTMLNGTTQSRKLVYIRGTAAGTS